MTEGASARKAVNVFALRVWRRRLLRLARHPDDKPLRGSPTISKVAGVVDPAGLTEPSSVLFNGSAGRAMMRYNSAVLSDGREDNAELRAALRRSAPQVTAGSRLRDPATAKAASGMRRCEEMAAEEFTEQVRAVLTGESPWLAKQRRAFRRIPSPPRCKLCADPFAGLGGVVFRHAGVPAILRQSSSLHKMHYRPSHTPIDRRGDPDHPAVR